MSTFKDVILMVGLVILVISGSVALAGLVLRIEGILIGDAIFGLTWLDVTLTLSFIAYWVVIARLIKLYGNFP
jgi:hypothetical protein